MTSGHPAQLPTHTATTLVTLSLDAIALQSLPIDRRTQDTSE